jgi:uncharacterized protein YqgV (UPF0045/DUF77 family)
MNNKNINVAIQILPISSVYANPIKIIDKAIALITKSGLNYKVCPFETVVEGEYDKVFDLVKAIQEECYKHGAEELICNLKIHTKHNNSVYISEKMEKYI